MQRHQFGGPEPDNYPMQERIAREQEPKLEKRPVAFRVRGLGGWILYEDESEAYRYAEANGLQMQGLYVRDGT